MVQNSPCEITHVLNCRTTHGTPLLFLRGENVVCCRLSYIAIYITSNCRLSAAKFNVLVPWYTVIIDKTLAVITANCCLCIVRL